MSALGSVFYFLTLTLGLVYAVLILCYPKFTLRPPANVWRLEKIWVREIGIFYAAVILGLVANGLILYFIADLKTIKIVIGPTVLITIGISLIADVRWKSTLGILLDLLILACTAVSIIV